MCALSCVVVIIPHGESTEMPILEGFGPSTKTNEKFEQQKRVRKKCEKKRTVNKRLTIAPCLINSINNVSVQYNGGFLPDIILFDPMLLIGEPD